MSNFGKDISKYVMVVYMKDNSCLRFYSLSNEDRKGMAFSVKAMVRRLLERKLRNRYHTAIVYDRISDREILKYVDGIKVTTANV